MKKKKEEFKLDGYEELSPGVFKKRVVEVKAPVVTTEDGYFFQFEVDPIGKPRMTQSDRWKKRPATDRYWELKSKLKLIAGIYKFVMPDSGYHMIFYIAMPKSWSAKKKEQFDGKPHQSKPDKDNLEKAVLDSLCEEDSYIWDGRASKYWAYKGSIVIKNIR